MLGGSYSACYCADFEANAPRSNYFDSADPLLYTTCDADNEFTHPAGVVVVRGADGGQHFECVKNASCSFTVTGYSLNKADGVQVIPYDYRLQFAPTCTAGTPATPYFTEARSGALGSGSGVVQIFQVGIGEIQNTYTVCYCARFDKDVWGVLPTSGTAMCDEDVEFSHQAATLVVRGGISDELYRCHRGSPCVITVSGWALQSTDRLRVVAYGASCKSIASSV
ncbi:unnamed protein product, partial [Polarella glacialis]